VGIRDSFAGGKAAGA